MKITPPPGWAQEQVYIYLMISGPISPICGIPGNSGEFRGIPGNSGEFRGTPGNSGECRGIKAECTRLSLFLLILMFFLYLLCLVAFCTHFVHFRQSGETKFRGTPGNSGGFRGNPKISKERKISQKMRLRPQGISHRNALNRRVFDEF